MAVLRNITGEVFFSYECLNNWKYKAVFNIRHTLEKCKEFNVEIHQIFVDYKATYDSVKREKLWNMATS